MSTYQIKDLKLTARMICQEMVSRGVEVEVINRDPSLVRYRVNDNWRFLHSVISEHSSAMAATIADNKLLSAKVFELYGWNHPETAIYTDDRALEEFIEANKRIVIKPLDSAHGHGVSVDIDNLEDAKLAISKARKFSERILLQQMVEGEDYRLTCIDGKFVAAMKRTPASVVGDGKSTVAELIDIENQHPNRGGYEKPLLKISAEGASDYIGSDNMSRVPSLGETVRLAGPANISLGGSVVDATDEVSEDMIRTAEDVASKLNMGICGVDFLWNQPNPAHLIEININPGISSHDIEFMGQSRNVIKSAVDYLIANDNK
ncbi:hypothetical protein CR969_01685 [Candidatus Saccharibacteria bacterium]|nr:MAG: hypothetical protein CR969_01685 [Candidatus Saccharibacteria bacterium]